ncbi:MAG: cytochrome c [Pirellulales bacterium]
MSARGRQLVAWSPRGTRRGAWLCCALGALALAGCQPAMTNQPRYESYEGTSFFSDGRSMRPPVEGSVARGTLDLAGPRGTGREAGKFVLHIPFEVDRATVLRGRERFNIYCAPCHDQTGSGRGMIVLRGYPPPPSLHTEALRQAPDGQLFDVITNGYRQMPDYAAQVPVDDRWAIIAYIRALQISQHATLDEVPPGERSQLEAAPADEAAPNTQAPPAADVEAADANDGDTNAQEPPATSSAAPEGGAQ